MTVKELIEKLDKVKDKDKVVLGSDWCDLMFVEERDNLYVIIS